MKIKIGFVSNSSSTSFIVSFPKRIKKFDDVFSHIPEHRYAHEVFEDVINRKYYESHYVKVKQGILVKDETDESSNKKLIEKLTKEITSGYFDGYISVFDSTEYKNNKKLSRGGVLQKEDFNEFNELCKKYEEINEKLARELAIKFVSRNKGKFLYFFQYCDEGGGLCAEMEHNDIFSNLDLIEVSHH